MTATTARVEVLTAEVRTLVVGSRQVTLSVYSQLDGVRPAFIEPFGRVRVRAHCNDGYYGSRVVSSDCPGDCLDVVGRSISTGALVRACVPRYRTDDGEDEQVIRLRCLREWDRLPLIVLAGLR
jgi:hypothetical protein